VLTLLSVGEIFNQTVAVQQVYNLRQAVLQAFLRLFGFYFSHWRAPPPEAEHAKGDQSVNTRLGNRKFE
jgi:hypothetical protein